MSSPKTLSRDFKHVKRHAPGGGPAFNGWVGLGVGLALGLSLLHGITLLFAIFIAACCFSAIGMLLAVPPTNVPSNIMMLSSLIKFPLVFISGIFIPLEQMPFWGLVLSVISPLTYFTDLVRYSFTGIHYFPVWIDIVALAVFTIVFTIGTMYLHRRTMPQRM